MAQQKVIITGIMVTEDTVPQPPLGIWGPTDPRPTNPIAGWNPGTGTFPPWSPPQQPPGIWGPTDPRPTLPIAGWDPGTGTFPRPPQPPGGGGGGIGTFPGNLPASDPEGSGWVYAFVPGYGWMWAKVPQKPGTEPTPEPPPEQIP